MEFQEFEKLNFFSYSDTTSKREKYIWGRSPKKGSKKKKELK